MLLARTEHRELAARINTVIRIEGGDPAVLCRPQRT